MKVNLTKREIELILFAMKDYEVVGDHEISMRVKAHEYDTAEKIVDKIKYLYPDKE